MRKILSATAAAVALFATAASASSSLLAASGDSTTQIYAGDTTAALKLSDAGGTQLNFHTTKANQTVEITFSFDCNIFDPINMSANVAVYVQADGHNVNPSGTSLVCPAAPTGAGIWQSVTLVRSYVAATPGMHAVALDFYGSSATSIAQFQRVATIVQW